MARDQIEEVKQKTDIVSLISEYVNLKKAGRNFKAPCPFHAEKTPSFMVSPELQIYKCFGCFPAGQFVKTPFGYHKIEDIVPNEYIISGKGNIRKVEASYVRDYDGDLIKIKPSRLTEEISLTGNHPVYVVGGSPLYKNNYKYLSRKLNNHKKYDDDKRLSYLWKYTPIEKVNARELKKGMTLLYPINSTITDLKNIDLSDYITKEWPSHGKKPAIPRLNIPVNASFLKLIGYYIAEGSNHRAYIRFSLGDHEGSFAREIVGLIKQVFGLEASIHKRNNGRNGIEITLCNSILANIFENLCGKSAHNKHIPFVFQQLPPDKQRHLLDAVFKGDGHERLCRKATVLRRQITIASRILSEQLTDILLRLGYFPSKYIQKEKVDKNKVNHKQSYSVNWAVDPKASKHKHIYEDKEGNIYWLLPILDKKTENFSGKVYNLRVEEDHSYVANSFAVANCGESGDAFSFLEKYEGMDFGEALKVLADKAGVKLKPTHFKQRGEKEELYEINNLASKFYQYVLLKHSVGKPALNYLINQRGLKLDTIKKFQIGFSPISSRPLLNYLTQKKKVYPVSIIKSGLAYKGRGGLTDRFCGRVIFPLFDHRGNPIGFSGRLMPNDKRDMGKYINSPETPTYHKSNVLYGLNLTRSFIKKKGEAIVVEGELDLISSWQIGVRNVVAMKGTALTEDQVRLISRFSEKIILALDTDFAGNEAATRGITIAQNEGLEVAVSLMGKYKDPDEAARKDPEFFEKAIKNPIDVWEFIIDFVCSKHNVKTGAGKAKVSRELSQILAQIEDRIVQAHYVKMLSEKLDVPLESVAEQISKTEKKEKVEGKRFKVLKTKSKKTRKEMLEERFLSLFFQSEELDFENKNLDLITTPLNKRIVDEFKGFINGKNKPKLSNFVKELPEELKEGFAGIALRDVEEYLDTDIFKKEMSLVVKELQKLTLKEKRSEIVKRMRMLEQKGKSRQAKKLSELFDKLGKKLAILEQE